VEGIEHQMDIGAPHVSWEDGIQGAVEAPRLPFVGHLHARHLSECVDTGIRAACADHGDVRLRQARESLLEHTLHRSLRGLPLPAREGPSIVLNDQLEGAARHWVKARPAHG
jgi:hypothetical protein